METLIKKETLIDGIEIELHDFSNALDSRENTLSIIEKVAGLSFNKEEVKDPEKLFNHLLTESAGCPSSVFEFIWGGLVFSEVFPTGKLIKMLKYGIPLFYNKTATEEHFTGHLNLRTALSINMGNMLLPIPNWHKANIYTFKLKIPIWMRAQLIRHRQASWMELSRRRVGQDFDFYQSDRDICLDGEEYNTFVDAKYEYKLKCNEGVPKEVARGVLPQNLFTKIWVQFQNTPESWQNFIELRAEPGKEKTHTQFETNRVARKMKEMLDNFLEEA